jgi:hypothetical protein
MIDNVLSNWFSKIIQYNAEMRAAKPLYRGHLF